MRYLFTLILLAGSSVCFGQFARDTEPAAPQLVSAAAAQSYFAGLDSPREEAKVYICDSKTAKAYHSDQHCRGLQKCSHEVVKVTKEQAEEDHGRVKCQVCY